MKDRFLLPAVALLALIGLGLLMLSPVDSDAKPAPMQEQYIDEPAPLTDAEFEQLQRDLRKDAVQLAVSGCPGTCTLNATAVVKDDLPIIDNGRQDGRQQAWSETRRRTPIRTLIRAAVRLPARACGRLRNR